MAVPVVASFATANQLATGTTFSIAKPSGVTNGDVLYLILIQDNTATVATTPTGWTAEGNIIISSTPSSCRVWLWSQRADGTDEPDPQTITTDGNRYFAGAYLRVTGVDAGVSDLTHVFNSGTDLGDTTGHTSPSVTTTVADCLILSVFGSDDADAAGATSMVAAGGETEVCESLANGFTQPIIGVYRTNAASTGTYSHQVTFSAASQAAMMIWAINAAVPGAGPSGGGRMMVGVG